MAELATGTSPLRARLEREAALLRLTLDRPKANLIDAAMIAALSSALAAHRGTQGLRCHINAIHVVRERVIIDAR